MFVTYKLWLLSKVPSIGLPLTFLGQPEKYQHISAMSSGQILGTASLVQLKDNNKIHKLPHNSAINIPKKQHLNFYNIQLSAFQQPCAPNSSLQILFFQGSS
jgi:hypothetical protein